MHETDAGLPVTAFVHVIDCRPDAIQATEAAGATCAGSRAGNLYIQYWTLLRRLGDPARRADRRRRGLPPKTTGRACRSASGPTDGSTSGPPRTTATTTCSSVANAGSDAGIDPLNDAAEAVGARPHDGWGPETRLLVVSGGSHAGNTNGFLRIDRVAPGRRVHLVPLEPIAAEEGDAYRFAVSPPWRKRVWRDPEATGTD